MRNTFRGHDRRVLENLRDAIHATEKRDALALDTAHKTARIKTRLVVISPMDAALTAAWALVKARVLACLALHS